MSQNPFTLKKTELLSSYASNNFLLNSLFNLSLNKINSTTLVFISTFSTETSITTRKVKQTVYVFKI
jgi:hypothetical protein